MGGLGVKAVARDKVVLPIREKKKREAELFGPACGQQNTASDNSFSVTT